MQVSKNQQDKTMQALENTAGKRSAKASEAKGRGFESRLVHQ